MNIWLYHGRHGELKAFPGTEDGFDGGMLNPLRVE